MVENEPGIPCYDTNCHICLKKKKKEEDRSQRCSRQLERVLKGQIWDNLSTQLIKYSTEIQTTKKLESVSLCQGWIDKRMNGKEAGLSPAVEYQALTLGNQPSPAILIKTQQGPAMMPQLRGCYPLTTLC